MLNKLLCGALGFGMLIVPALVAADQPAEKPKPKKTTTSMSSDMQRAIAWEHFKDMAAARQARMEARHPSVTEPSANRSADRSTDQDTQGDTVKDPGPGKQIKK